MTLGWPDQGDMVIEGTLPDPVTTTMMAGLRIPESIKNTMKLQTGWGLPSQGHITHYFASTCSDLPCRAKTALPHLV